MLLHEFSFYKLKYFFQLTKTNELGTISLPKEKNVKFKFLKIFINRRFCLLRKKKFINSKLKTYIKYANLIIYVLCLCSYRNSTVVL
jgi:hypothetical protein